MSFDFEAAVTSPFRMQPGLRRLPPGAPQLTPATPGARHQREKLAVLTAFAPQALCAVDGFDAAAALATLCREAAAADPSGWCWDGEWARAHRLGTAVRRNGAVEQTGTGAFGLGDEIARCLGGLAPTWRLAGLLSLAHDEDFAVIDGRDGTLAWLMVALPSHWAPEAKLGRGFADVHAPVADNTTLLKARPALLRLATGAERWERFVWNVTDHPRLHAHPDRVDPARWQHTAPGAAWWRTERQTFIPVPANDQAIFTIRVDVQTLATVVEPPSRAAALHAAIGSMSAAVLDYRHLTSVREPLLAWLADRM